MALTVVKYRKTPTGTIAESNQAFVINKISTGRQEQYVVKKPLVKVHPGGGLVFNKIPAVIKPANPINTLKRANSTVLESPEKKYSLQTVASSGTPLTSFQWQQTIGGTGTSAAIKKEQLGQALSSLPPNTIIQAKTVPRTSTPTNTTTILQRIGPGTTIKPVSTSSVRTLSSLPSSTATVQVQRPTYFIKREARSIKNITVDLIEKNPEIHLGLKANRLPLIKNVICPTTGVSIMDCYLVFKKLKLNEDFSLLAEYFEMSLEEVHHVFTKALVQLARFLKFLIKFSDKNYYDRHKDTPIAYRSKLCKVQSLIECVETDIEQPENSKYECKKYKFILSISTNDIICYVSEVYLGNYDDLTIFHASNFKDNLPKHLSLVCDPAKGIYKKEIEKKMKEPSATDSEQEPSTPSKQKETHDSTTDSAEEPSNESAPESSKNRENNVKKPTAEDRINPDLINPSNASLSIVKNHLKSRFIPNLSIPTTKVDESICRDQICNVIDRLRSFKILQPYGIHEPMLYQYLSEMVVVAASLLNLQR